MVDNEKLMEIISKLKSEYKDDKIKLYILECLQLSDVTLMLIKPENYYNYISDGINNIFSITEKSTDKFQLQSESEIGFTEYKLRLDTKTENGLHKTLHQIKRRLYTAKQLIGSEEAHYVFGVRDKGMLGDLSKDDISETCEIFESLIKSKNLNAYVYSKHEYLFEKSYVYYLIIHKKNDIKFKEFKIAFVGTSGSGKTTTISHLLHGTPKKTDLVFKHEHEKITGETTSIRKEIIGIKNNKLINYKTTSISSIIDIAIESDSIINIFDYPGNIKKIRTTFKGLLSNDNNLIISVIDAKNLKKTEELEQLNLYKKISDLLNIKFTIVVTKIDLVDNYDEDLFKSLFDDNVDILFIANNNLEGIQSLVEYLENIEQSLSIKTLTKQTILIDDTRKIMSREHIEVNILLNNLFTVSELINIPDKGVVFSGVMHVGDYKLGDTILLTNGIECIESRIKSIHKKYIDSKILYQGETGSIQLENVYKIPDYYKRSVISRKPFVSYNNINLIIDKKDFDCKFIKKNDKFKLYSGNIRTNAHVTNITENYTTYILMLKLNPTIIPKLEIYGKDVGIICDDKRNTYCGALCILSTINE